MILTEDEIWIVGHLLNTSNILNYIPYIRICKGNEKIFFCQ